jgi:hypothetical protein
MITGSLGHMVTLASALPHSHVVLRWRDDSDEGGAPTARQRDVGSHPCCDVRTDVWRDAVIQCEATASLLPHELLFGLPGLPRVELEPGAGVEELGGVYRCDGVDLFVTPLDAFAVQDAIDACAAPGHARVGIRRDDLVGMSLVALEHLVGPPPGDASLAWALLVECAVREVSLTV